VIVGGAALVVLALLAAMVGGEGEQQVALGNDGASAQDDPTRVERGNESVTPTSTSATSTPTSTAGDPTITTELKPVDGGDVPVSVGVSETGDQVGDPAAPPSTTTTTLCLNSYDAACGSFRWTRAVGPNQPMVATIELVTEHPVVDERVYFRLRASDPDATPVSASAWLNTPAQGSHWLVPGNCGGSGSYEAFGPWTPPEPTGGSIERVDTVLPHTPGVYRVFGCFRSSSWPVVPPEESDFAVEHACPGDGETWMGGRWWCYDPYRDFVSPYIDITVYAE
jgi:hypothetical protein